MKTPKKIPSSLRRADYRAAQTDRDGFVYLFRLGEFHKIGCTFNVPKRILSLLTLPYEAELVHQFPSRDAFQVEQALHRHYVHKRYKGEWFRLRDEDIADLCAVDRADSVCELPERLRPRGAGTGKISHFRVSGDLRDAIDALLLKSRRSLTAEVSIALEKHLEAEGLWPPPEKKGPAK